MKKRAKIITTIASLCLAVALMAFGVYAAQTATLNVTSTVSFVAQDVKVHWTVGVVRGTGANAETLVDSSTNANTYNLNTVGKEGWTDDGTNQGAEELTATLGNFQFTLSGRTITYTFTCYNESHKQSIDISVDDTSLFRSEEGILNVTYKQGLANSTLTVNDEEEWDGVELAADGVYVYQVILELVDITSDISTDDQALTVAFSAVKHTSA